MDSRLNLVCKVLLVAIGLGVCLGIALRWRANSRRIHQTERTIREAVNQRLLRHKVDPLSVVALTEASRLFGVPEVVKFEQPLFQTTEATGRRPYGTVSGQFNRKTGEIEIDLELADGRRERGVRAQLTPVP